MEYNYEIMYNNKKEIVIRYYCESITRLNKRLEFLKILEKYKIDFKEATKLSKLWYNIIYNKAKYDSQLYNQIMKYNKLLEVQI